MSADPMPLYHFYRLPAMTEKCNCCGKDVPDMAADASRHDECDEEWERRFDESLCVRCGVKVAEGKIGCDECNHYSPYKGYENCYAG